MEGKTIVTAPAPVVVVLVIGLLGGPQAPDSDRCNCAAAAETDGWCEVHGLGFIAGVEIVSKKLFEALDAHGHQVDHDSFRCAACRAAIDEDGFCREHRIGFVGGEAYFSSLAYHLARGKRVRLAEIGCPVCRENAGSHGWCEQHGIGMIGAVSIDVRADFDELQRALKLLEAANAAAPRCDHCAVAIVTDTRCPICRIDYVDGKPRAGN